MKWRFYPQQPTDPIRNPISGEFFSTEAVGDPTDGLVREAVQNTLDARQKFGANRETAKVRIYLSGVSGALSASKVSTWLDGLWPHAEAPGNGLGDQPKRQDICPFLVYEDFGTTGLTGDPSEHQVVEGNQNNFLNFFRAEGHSDKGEHDRGSWGVGKTVFPRASRISSFFGLSVRSDDQRALLLGRSILKYHRIGKQVYKSDGYFGEFRGDGFALPIEQPLALDQFRQDFRLKRLSEPGLSIVVPWYEADTDDGLTHNKVVFALLGGFFYPILMGHLSVLIQTPTSSLSLDATSIASAVAKLPGDEAQELSSMLELATWAQTRLEPEFRHLASPPGEGTQKWTPALMTTEVIQAVRTAFERREQVALRVHMHVQPRSSASPIATFSNVFLEHSDLDSNKPVFIRDELIITDVKAPRISQVRALVIVEDRPLANLLRDAETPAHTQWNPTTGNFKNKYKFGAGAIDFVRLAVSEILRIVNQSEQKPDPSITVDYFSIPIPPDADDDDAIPARKKKAKDKKGGALPTTVPTIPPTPRRFRIDRMRGGFSLRPADPSVQVPFEVSVRVAYDVRKGSPLKKYHEADFQLGKGPIRFEERGVKVTAANQNRMIAAITAADFRLDVLGFDPDRDIYVRADVREADNVD